MSKKQEKNTYVEQTPNQIDCARSKPEDFRVQHENSFFNGEGADDITGKYDDVKKPRTGRGLDVNHRVLKGEGGNGVLSRAAGKRARR